YVLSLEGKDEDEGRKEANNGYRLEGRQEALLEPLPSLAADEQSPAYPAGRERDHDEHGDGREENRPRHGYPAHANKKHHDRGKKEEHDQVVDCDLRQGIGR